MDDDIKEYCKTCNKCQTIKPVSKLRAQLQPILAKSPWDIIGIDIAGPLTLSKFGNKYIIVAIDYYTKFCIAQAISDFTALTTARFIFNEIICKFGRANRIHTDRGVNFESNLLNYATIIRRTLKNKDESFNYNKMLGYQNKIINFYNNTDKITGYNDYISLVNFYGIETYFTRGAFLDIVVNGQMCGSKSIELTDVDYLCSILENAGFFFNHNNKTKYVVRVNKTLEKLIDKNNLYNIPEIKELDTIINNFKIEDNGKVDYDKSYCKWINDDTFDLLKCEKYEIFNILFKLIYKLLKVYTENNQIYDNEFIFYNIFININNNENSISPALQHFSNKNRNRSLSSAIKNILD